MDYETGVICCLALAAGRLAYSLLTRFDTYHSNLGQMGLRQSWVTGAIKKGGSALWEIPLYLLIVAATAALSWGGLVLEVVYVVHAYWKDAGVPAEVRTIRWRLRNTKMDQETARACFLRTAEILIGRRALEVALDEAERDAA